MLKISLKTVLALISVPLADRSEQNDGSSFWVPLWILPHQYNILELVYTFIIRFTNNVLVVVLVV